MSFTIVHHNFITNQVSNTEQESTDLRTCITKLFKLTDTEEFHQSFINCTLDEIKVVNTTLSVLTHDEDEYIFIKHL